MSPIYRNRSNYPDLRLKCEADYIVRYYYPNGTLFTTSAFGSPFPARSYHFPKENLFWSSLIKDEIHGVRKGKGPESGRYPPGFTAHLSFDLSKAIRFVDSPRLYNGVVYLARVEKTQGGGPAPIIFKPTEWWETLMGYEGTYNWHSGFDGHMPPSSLTSILSEEAWNYFSDVLPEHLSFGEFVQGFTQLKDLLPAVQDSVTKTISGGYLNKKFGWDNLLSDLRTLSGLFDSVKERMDYFRRTYGIPTRLGFSRHIDWEHSWTDTLDISLQHQVRITLVEQRYTFRATAWIMQTLDYMTDLVGFLRVLAGELGLNNPIKAIWQTLPLSFVVDWFFRISTHLDNLTRLNPATGWFVYDPTESVTADWVFLVEQRTTASSGYNMTMASYSMPAKYYVRQPSLSFRWDLLNPSELSPSQLSLLLAMLHQYS